MSWSEVFFIVWYWLVYWLTVLLIIFEDFGCNIFSLEKWKDQIVLDRILAHWNLCPKNVIYSIRKIDKWCSQILLRFFTLTVVVVLWNKVRVCLAFYERKKLGSPFDVVAGITRIKCEVFALVARYYKDNEILQHVLIYRCILSHIRANWFAITILSFIIIVFCVKLRRWGTSFLSLYFIFVVIWAVNGRHIRSVRTILKIHSQELKRIQSLVLPTEQLVRNHISAPIHLDSSIALVFVRYWLLVVLGVFVQLVERQYSWYK